MPKPREGTGSHQTGREGRPQRTVEDWTTRAGGRGPAASRRGVGNAQLSLQLNRHPGATSQTTPELVATRLPLKEARASGGRKLKPNREAKTGKSWVNPSRSPGPVAGPTAEERDGGQTHSPQRGPGTGEAARRGPAARAQRPGTQSRRRQRKRSAGTRSPQTRGRGRGGAQRSGPARGAGDHAASLRVAAASRHPHPASSPARARARCSPGPQALDTGPACRAARGLGRAIL